MDTLIFFRIFFFFCQVTQLFFFCCLVFNGRERKALEWKTVLEHVVTTWFIQQPEEIKQNWTYLREQLIQHFVNNNVTQTTLQPLNNLHEHAHELMAQFAIKMK